MIWYQTQPLHTEMRSLGVSAAHCGHRSHRWGKCSFIVGGWFTRKLVLSEPHLKLPVRAGGLILKHEAPSDTDGVTTCQSRLLCPLIATEQKRCPQRILPDTFWHRAGMQLVVAECHPWAFEMSVWVTVQLHSPAAVCLITSVHTMHPRSSRWNILTLQMITLPHGERDF